MKNLAYVLMIAAVLSWIHLLTRSGRVARAEYRSPVMGVGFDR